MLDYVIDNAKKTWKTDPICLMTEQEIRAKVKEQIASQIKAQKEI